MEQGLARLNMRNMLMGLGASGLCCTAGLETNPFVFYTPVSAADLTMCVKLPNLCLVCTSLATQDVAKDPVYLAK